MLASGEVASPVSGAVGAPVVLPLRARGGHCFSCKAMLETFALAQRVRSCCVKTPLRQRRATRTWLQLPSHVGDLCACAACAKLLRQNAFASAQGTAGVKRPLVVPVAAGSRSAAPASQSLPGGCPRVCAGMAEIEVELCPRA